MSAREIEQQLLAIIEGSFEDAVVPDAIAAHADKRAGKPVTKTDAEQLEAQVGLPVCVTRRYGMTQVAWAVGKGLNPWAEERSILLAHADTNVRWPSSRELRQKNPAYFEARDERNAARKKLLGEHRAQETFFAGIAAGTTTQTGPIERTSVVSRAAAAIVKLREARAVLDALLEYEQPLRVVQSTVEKLVEKG